MPRDSRSDIGSKRDFPSIWRLSDREIETWLLKRARKGVIRLDFMAHDAAEVPLESDEEGHAGEPKDSDEAHVSRGAADANQSTECTISAVGGAIIDAMDVIVDDVANMHVWKGVFRSEELHEMEEEVRKLSINENAVVSERRCPLSRRHDRVGSHKAWMKGRVASVLEQRGILDPISPVDTCSTVVYMDRGASTGWESNWCDGDGDVLVHVQLFTTVVYSLGCGSHHARYRVRLQRGEVLVISGSNDDTSPLPLSVQGRNDTDDIAHWGVQSPPTAALVLGRRLGPVDVSRIAHLSTQFRFSIGKFTPTDFQRAILSHIQFLRLKSPHKSGLIVMATALGKTVMCILDVELELRKYTGTIGNMLAYDSCPCCKKPSEQRVAEACEALEPHFDFLVIFLVHTRSIRDHAMAKFRRHFGEMYPNSFEEFVGDRVPSRRCRFLFCLFQSFSNVPESTLARVTHVIVDECHHLLASTYHAAYTHLRSLPNVVYILGLTATLFHAEDPTGQQLMGLFDHNYIDLPWQGAKRLRIFPDVEYVETVPVDTLETYNGYLQACTHPGDGSINITRFVNCLDKSISGSNAKIVENLIQPEKVVGTLLEYQTQRALAGQPQRRHILIFAPHIDGANAIACELAKKGVSVTVAHSKLRENEVTRNLESFVRGDVQVLVNVAIVNEGFDAPHVDCVVLARATESEIVFVQQIGRGLRRDTKNGCRDVAVLDMAMNLRRRWVRLHRGDRVEGTSKHGARKGNHAQNAQLEGWIKDFWSVDTFMPGLQVNDST